MAYRTSARAQQNSDTAVCCARCGSLTSLALESNSGGRFTCRKCEHDQPVLREADDVALEKLELTDYHLGNYEELHPFAKELGKDAKNGGLDLLCDGIVTKIGINVNSGTVMGLDHHAATSGLPKMRFVTEKPSHVDDKERGVVKEVQTGDPSFDDEVYIESAASDADVLAVLSSPAVRMGIRKLLYDATAVTVDENGVSVFVHRDHDPWFPKRLRQRLAWLRVVAGAPRALVTEYVRPPARARIVARFVGFSFPVALFLTILGLAKWTPTNGEAVAKCIGAGIAIAVLMLPVWSLLLRGRSTSHREITGWRITTFIWGPLLVLGVLTTYNGASDESTERVVTMKIENVTHGSDDEGYHAETHDEEGASHSYSFNAAPKVGDQVQVGWRKGALGWSWESSAPIVLSQASTKP